MKNAFLVASFVIAACGGSTVAVDGGPTDSSTPDTSVADAGSDATSDATVDTKPTTDAPPAFDVQIPDVSLPDANFTCKDPTTCNGQLCCAEMVLGAGSPPNCPVTSISSACKATCPTQLVLSCNATQQVRFCSKKADCTEAANNNCCLFEQGGQQLTFCAPSLITGIAKQCFN